MQIDYKKVLVAHRGDHLMAPENSIRSFQAALDAGASFFELDVQLSKDLKPFVGHDVNLIRTVRKDIDIFDTMAVDLKYLLPDLKSVVSLFNQNHKSTVFVEIKKQSVDKFGTRTTFEAVTEILKAARFEVVIISYKPKIVSLARESGFKVGWVSDAFNHNTIAKANNLQVDYMFSDAGEVLKQNNFEKKWQLVVYTVNDSSKVDELLNHGVDLIETDHFLKIYRTFNNVV